MPAKTKIHLPNRTWATRLFYAGLVCLLISTFINFVYIRPTNFKAQYRAHQLSDCLKTTTSRASCEANFGKK